MNNNISILIQEGLHGELLSMVFSRGSDTFELTKEECFKFLRVFHGKESTLGKFRDKNDYGPYEVIKFNSDDGTKKNLALYDKH